MLFRLSGPLEPGDVAAVLEGREGAAGAVLRNRRDFWQAKTLGLAIADRGGEMYVRFYVRRKQARSRLRHAVPRNLEIALPNGEILRVPTDVVELRAPPTFHLRAIAPGDPIANPGGREGTLGVRVFDSEGIEYALTCAHVVAPFFLKAPRPLGDKVDSPVPPKKKAGTQSIGVVESWSPFDVSKVHFSDAALIHAAGDITLSNESLRLAPGPSFAEKIDPVLAAGPKPRFAEVHTARKVVRVELDFIHNNLFFDFSGTEFEFSRVLRYHGDVREGDSGSAVVDESTRLLLGLHFAGDENTQTGYCVLTRNVLAAFPDYGLKIAP